LEIKIIELINRVLRGVCWSTSRENKKKKKKKKEKKRKKKREKKRKKRRRKVGKTKNDQKE